MKSFIKFCRNFRYLSLALSIYCTVVVFSYWCSPPTSVPAPTPLLVPSPAPVHQCHCDCSLSPSFTPQAEPPVIEIILLYGAWSVLGYLFLYFVVGYRVWHFILRQQRSRNRRKSLIWRYGTAVCKWLIELIATGGSPILSAFLGRKIPPHHTVLTMYGVFSIFFLCATFGTSQEFGLIDALIAVVLGMLVASKEAIAWLAKFLNVHQVGDAKIFLLFFISGTRALRRASLPVVNFLNAWASSDKNLVEFMDTYNYTLSHLYHFIVVI
ncbi:hypothetical protein OROMI_022808 [Orobanche minor]